MRHCAPAGWHLANVVVVVVDVLVVVVGG